MPIDHEARIAITLRLRSAYEGTLAGYAQRRLGYELLGDIALAQEWPAISAAYSGIEQTLKFLLALDKALTVNELLPDKGIDENPGGKPTKYRIHQLGILFSRLGKGTRDSVERDYKIWQSLYDYIPIHSCSEYLDHIQGNHNNGHLDWRYCLIQEELPLKNSSDAMLAIWGLLVRRCEEREEIPHRASTHTADEEVRLGLGDRLERACMNCEQRAVENGDPLPPLREELKRWAPSGACMVNNIAALLGHRKRYLEPEHEGSEPMRRMLDECLKQLTHDAGAGQRGALPTFARRALGCFPTGESVRWNPETMRFENVAWPLQSESRDDAPLGATRVAPEDNADGRLRDIWHHARVAGYKVKETREFAALIDQPIQWHLRMRVYDQHEGAEDARISVWQEHNLEGAIAVEQHAPDAPLPPHMDRWLRLCKCPVRGKWLAHDTPY